MDNLSEQISVLRAGAEIAPYTLIDEWNWQNLTIPDLQARGFEHRHIRRVYPKWNNPAQEHTFKLLMGLLRGNGAIVALTGQRGTGKTQMACELCRLRTEARRAYYGTPIDERGEAKAPPESGRYVKLSKIGSLFKSLYADFGSVDAEALTDRFNAYANETLLIIDEVHESEDLKTQMRMLTDLVDRRYAALKDTVLISNYTDAEFQQNVNPSIISRLSEHGRILSCKWKSFRAQ